MITKSRQCYKSVPDTHRVQPWGAESAQCLWWKWNGSPSSAGALSATLVCSMGGGVLLPHDASCLPPPVSALFPPPLPPFLPSWSLSSFPSSHGFLLFLTTALPVTSTDYHICFLSSSFFPDCSELADDATLLIFV